MSFGSITRSKIHINTLFDITDTGMNTICEQLDDYSRAQDYSFYDLTTYLILDNLLLHVY